MTISRRSVAAGIVAGVAASSVAGSRKAEAAAPSNAKINAKNVVLVHGLFADGSVWMDVIERLQAHGLNVTSVQNPLTSLPDSIAATQRVLARQDGPTVLVGHSFAGVVISEAGMHANVSSLVYVAALAPEAGENFPALAQKYPAPPVGAGVVFDGDEGRLNETTFLNEFAFDLPRKRARLLYAVQQPFQKALFAGRTTQAAWKSKPSFYAVSTEDRAINPDYERFMAKRIGAKTIEIPSGHLSLVSHPARIAGLILEAAGRES